MSGLLTLQTRGQARALTTPQLRQRLKRQLARAMSAAGEIPGEVDVMLDLGEWMLLRFHCADGRNWIPLALPRDGFSAMYRAALHAHSGRAAAPALRQSDDDG